MGRLATKPLPSRGSPIEGDKFRRVYLTPELLGADSLVRGGRGGKNRHGGEWSNTGVHHLPPHCPPGHCLVILGGGGGGLNWPSRHFG